MENPAVPRKLLETACRRWWLLVLPVVLVPLLVVLLIPQTATYTSTAALWVTRSGAAAGVVSQPGAESLARTQVQVLNDLLATESFRTQSAIQAGFVAADAPGTEKQMAAAVIGVRVSAAAPGPNVMTISARGRTAEGAQHLATGVLGQFVSRLAAEDAREATAVVGYYEKQLGVAQSEMAKTQAAAAAYVRAHPGADSKTDTDYLALQTTLDVQTSLTQKLQGSLQDARASAAAGGLQSVFVSVQDAPSYPLSPDAVSLSKRLAMPVAGAVAGLAIAAAYLYLAYRADHTIRSREDLAGLPVRVLGLVPELALAQTAAGRFAFVERLRPRNRNFARRVAVSLPPSPGGQATP